MKSFLLEVQSQIREAMKDMDVAKPEELKVFARRLAAIEMRLQAARSLLEARMFEADADNLEEEAKRSYAEMQP